MERRILAACRQRCSKSVKRDKVSKDFGSSRAWLLFFMEYIHFAFDRWEGLIRDVMRFCWLLRATWVVCSNQRTPAQLRQPFINARLIVSCIIQEGWIVSCIIQERWIELNLKASSDFWFQNWFPINGRMTRHAWKVGRSQWSMLRRWVRLSKRLTGRNISIVFIFSLLTLLPLSVCFIVVIFGCISKLTTVPQHWIRFYDRITIIFIAIIFTTTMKE